MKIVQHDQWNGLGPIAALAGLDMRLEWQIKYSQADKQAATRVIHILEEARKALASKGLDDFEETRGETALRELFDVWS